MFEWLYLMGNSIKHILVNTECICRNENNTRINFERLQQKNKAYIVVSTIKFNINRMY